MQRVFGAVLAAVLVLMAGAASADQVTGKICLIDRIANRIVVAGKSFAISPSNTVGPKIHELKPGDVVRVTFSSRSSSDVLANAMKVKKLN